MLRFFDPQTLFQDQLVELDEAAAHHATRVLRLQEGEELTLFNGKGGEWMARVEKIDRRTVTVLPIAFLADNREPTVRAHLWLPLIKGERLDWALQKATEMGAASIQLYTSERTEVQLKEERLEKKLRQWHHILISACEQCGLNLLPQLLPPIALSQLWPKASTPLRLVALPDTTPLTSNDLSDTELTLLTGPEGGFSPAELQQAKAFGFTAFSLGRRVLRAETAPVALMAALHVMAGAC